MYTRNYYYIILKFKIKVITYIILVLNIIMEYNYIEHISLYS